jgi:hypothetical protein
MRIRKKDFDIFNLSFLDVISCGFGAVVLLVLISKTSEDTSKSSLDEAEALLTQVVFLETKIDTLEKEIDTQNQKNNTQLKESGNLNTAANSLSERLGKTEKEEKNLDGDLDGLSLVKSSLKRVSITPATTNTTRDEEVGGIPVDSDYVLFVVDTSGSMKEIWSKVSNEVLNALSIHPKVKGFQILNDQGKALIPAYSGKWIPDTPVRRKGAMRVFDLWADASNSSPVEGIEMALKRYAQQGRSMAIYVFGDDYTGGSYNPVIDKITQFNKGENSSRRLAKIHGVGFKSNHTTDRFSILMRELTRRNGGTFIALP